jgi:GrpB-like predicted nucleotidyltransferase (UPF0157 family)/GNAT superfamily N-acetyltransferase
VSSPVVIVRYRKAWPRQFAREKQRIRAALSKALLGIEHVGSTSVPGLAAKPVVDIMAGVRNRQAAERSLAALARIGYLDVSPCDEYPDWYYCLGKGKRPHDAHLHLCRWRAGFWTRHLQFRDYLRTHPAQAREYAALKRRLARRHGTDRQGYCDAKTGFIRWCEVNAQGIDIRRMMKADIPRLARAFASWHKPQTQFGGYWQDLRAGRRVVLVARQGTIVVGYGTLVWRPRYRPFRNQGIPEVVDLNTRRPWRRRGIATAIIFCCGQLARRQGRRAIGISVGTSPDYAAARRLYPKLGFVPDGRGVTRHDKELHSIKAIIG